MHRLFLLQKVVLCDRFVESVLIGNNGRVEGVRIAGGEKYRANKAVISNIDAKR
jgi:beta-carotene ketolase (CrtO type)